MVFALLQIIVVVDLFGVSQNDWIAYAWIRYTIFKGAFNWLFFFSPKRV